LNLGSWLISSLGSLHSSRRTPSKEGQVEGTRAPAYRKLSVPHPHPRQHHPPKRPDYSPRKAVMKTV
jgi:hypothetical protein